MTEAELDDMYDAIAKAVHEAIEEVGIDTVRQMSMFPSSDYWNNDNV